MYFRLTAFIIFLLLVGMFILKFQVFLLAGLALLIVLFYVIFSSRFAIDKIGFIVLINYFYWLSSGLAVDAIDIHILLSPEFYNGDGRIFIYYIPLLFFSVYSATEKDIKFIVKLIQWLAIGSLFLLMMWASTHASFLSGGRAKNFFGLLTSHTGAGTFFSFVSIFLILYGIESKKRYFVISGLLMVLTVFTTASRQSMVALFAAMIWYITRNIQIKIVAISLLLTVILMLLLPVITPHTYKRTSHLFSMDLLRSISHQVERTSWKPGEEKELEEGEGYNILSRVLFWVYAVNRFKESPIIGIGFGRYNDYNLHMAGSKGIVYLATDGRQIISAGSAHNSYLHILSESGIIGLCLILWLWISIFSRLKHAITFHSESSIKGYFTACSGLIVFSLVGALFGHGLAAPSIGIPVMTVVGVGLSYYRRTLKKYAIDKVSPNHNIQIT